jgi:hypothetical protein
VGPARNKACAAAKRKSSLWCGWQCSRSRSLQSPSRDSTLHKINPQHKKSVCF